MYRAELINSNHPRWMNVTSTSAQTGSLLYKFLVSSLLPSYVDLSRFLKDLEGNFTYSSWGQPRLGWTVYSPNLPSLDVTISLYTPAGSSYTTSSIARAQSSYDFFTTLDPVFLVDG